MWVWWRDDCRLTSYVVAKPSTGDILKSVNHPLIIALHKTFQDDQYLYMLYQLCQGGELFALIQRERKRRHEVAKASGASGGHALSLMQARFFASCIISAITYLHKRRVL